MDQTKRRKVATDDLICPITLELPFDPVVAEDGRVYEYSAIQEHIARATPEPRATNHDDGAQEILGLLRSPITNEPMGPRLFPSPQIKGLIETLIENRSITGDFTDAWKRRETEKKKADLWLRMAQNDDVDAMFRVAWSYKKGTNGFRKDLDEALKWLKRAQSSGSIDAIAYWGLILCQGRMDTMKVEKKVSHGLVLLTVAATSGSSFASFYLGTAYVHGDYGLEVDKTQAIAWLQKTLCGNCSCPKLSNSARKDVQNLLEKLLHG